MIRDGARAVGAMAVNERTQPDPVLSGVGWEAGDSKQRTGCSLGKRCSPECP